MARYSIGIDLGTTNCALAAVEMVKRKNDVLPVPVEQLIAPGELAARPLLPSFLYLPSEHELPAGSLAVPWDKERSYLVGEAARNWGAKVTGRLVTSAKSWLCHDGVDRQAAILPWGGPSEVPKVSAVDASTRYLQHLAQSWNYQQRKEKNPARFEEQQITLTVPASFDDVARQLTAEAARRAGYLHVTLLEEPQAAFYAWIAHAERDRRRKQPLQEGMTCLVADVGGGTTDFSLIDCTAEDGVLGFTRRAVGDHLLLGGDNMDLALAHRMEEKLGAGKLDTGRFAQLTQACRAAKEILLTEKGPKEAPVTIMGRGRSVVASSLTATLTRAEVEEQIIEGFFPMVEWDSEPIRAKSTGIHEMGLPFVSDAAITRHLASFLREHEVTSKKPPAALLFNGGVFTAKILQDHFIAVLKKWFDRPDQPWEPIVLTTHSLDLAVAIGASYFGRQREYGGKAIAGGLARSYYIAVAGNNDNQKMLCVVPQHMEEGQMIELAEPVLELSLGQPVQFPLYTSTVREKDNAGQTLTIAQKHLHKLAPLQTVLRGGKRAGTRGVPVTLTSTLTPVGTLELSLVAQNSPNRWRLEFNTRDTLEADRDAETNRSESEANEPGTTIPEENIEVALNALTTVYSHSNEEPAKQLTKTWEQLLETGRRDWPSSLCRRLADGLLGVAESRRRSLAHLSRWYHLTGYCLRPGYGDAKDRFRVDQLWKLLFAPGKQPEGGADFWILWRRVSGGLPANLQLTLLDRLRPILLPGKGPAIKPNNNELAEMWRAAASLERLEPKVKALLAEPLLKQYRRPPVQHYAPWALARLGSRSMLYAPMNNILTGDVVSGWITQLLPYQPIHDSDQRAWLWTLTTLCRKINVRGLDVEDALRQQVISCLEQHHAPRRYIDLVTIGGELEKEEHQQMFGDDLPLGLKVMPKE
ncbi:MAG: Hsp70 family protein [Gemmatales bacterium]